MFCPFCGKETPDNAVFCASCGRQMPAKQEAPQAAGPSVAPQAAPQDSTAYAPEPQQAAAAYAQAVPPAASAAPGAAPMAPPPATQSAPMYPPPGPASPVMPVMPTSPAMPTAPAPAATGGAGKKLSGKVKIAIAVAAAVVVLGGGFAAAWFSGALDSVFNRNPPVVSSGNRGGDDDDVKTTTAAATTEKKDIDATTTESGGETTTSEEVTTARTTAVTTTTENGNNNGLISSVTRRTSPVMSALFRDMNIKPYTSNDVSSRGAVEETVINLSNAVLGSARNLAGDETRPGANVFGFECNVALDIPDSYLNEILSIMMPYGADPQMTEILRLAGSSEVSVSLEAAGDIVNSMLSPVFGVNADWQVNSRPFLSALGYFDLDDILFAVPGLSEKVLRVDSTMAPIPAEGFEILQSQPAVAEALSKYVDKLMPYIEEMTIAALNELSTPVEGTEDIVLGGKSVTVDTIDLEIREIDVYKAAIAALNVIKYSPEAQEIITEAFNDVLADMVGSSPINAQTLSMMLDSFIMQMNNEAEYAYSDEAVKVRLYMYDGLLSGMAVSIPSEAQQLGFSAITDYGYSFWFKDLYYSEFDEIKDNPPSQNDHGIGDHMEIHGALNSGANGLSGDVYLRIRENDEVFDEKLMTFSDLDMKVVFGMPVITGKFNVKMQDLYNAYSGKTSSSISSVWDTAYTMDSLDEYPIIKDLELTLDLSASSSEYKVIFMVADPSRNSKASVSFKGYLTDKRISPPQGPRVDVDDADADMQQEIMDEVLSNLEAKFDELTARGYDLTWLQQALYSQIMSAGSYGDYGDEFDWGGGAGTAAATTTAAGSISSDLFIEGYVFDNSSEDVLEVETLLSKTLDELVIARNEIYARHGWVFNDIDMQIYFNRQDWYIPIYDNDSIELNTVEQINIELIQEVENYFR